MTALDGRRGFCNASERAYNVQVQVELLDGLAFACGDTSVTAAEIAVVGFSAPFQIPYPVVMPDFIDMIDVGLCRMMMRLEMEHNETVHLERPL